MLKEKETTCNAYPKHLNRGLVRITTFLSEKILALAKIRNNSSKTVKRI